MEYREAESYPTLEWGPGLKPTTRCLGGKDKMPRKADSTPATPSNHAARGKAYTGAPETMTPGSAALDGTFGTSFRYKMVANALLTCGEGRD